MPSLWIHLDSLEYNKVYSGFLTMRNNELKNEINQSGFPSSF